MGDWHYYGLHSRREGQPMELIANNPAHLSGAIDAPGADKGTRFMQLCDAFDIPIVSLCDCPGIMAGPEIEKTAVVRHAARMFVTSANIDVPLMTIVTRAMVWVLRRWPGVVSSPPCSPQSLGPQANLAVWVWKEP